MNVGDTLQGYELIEPIAEGGMGTVWKAKHPNLNRLVAIKCIRADLLLEPKARDLFIEEVKHLSQLHSPQVVQVIDSGVSERNEPFMVTEFLNGEDLSDYLDSHGAMEPVEACRIGIQVLRALTEAHALGIIHGDLKPSNVFLMSLPGEKKPVVKVLDFGVASLMEEGHNEDETLGGRQVRGSIQYMAPEQLTRGRITAGADLYTFGAMMYRVLTNRHVFQGESDEQIRQKLTENPIPPSQASTVNSIPESLDDLVLSCVQRRLEDRPSSASALRRRLEMIAADLEKSSDRTKTTTALDASVPDWLESGFSQPGVESIPETEDSSRSTLRSADAIELDGEPLVTEPVVPTHDVQQPLLETLLPNGAMANQPIELDVSRTVEQAAPAIDPSSDSYGSDNYASATDVTGRSIGSHLEKASKESGGFTRRTVLLGALLCVLATAAYVLAFGSNGIFSSDGVDEEQVQPRKSAAQELEEGKAFLERVRAENNKSQRVKMPPKALNEGRVVVILPSKQKALFVNGSTGKKICPTAVQSCDVPRSVNVIVRAPGFQRLTLRAKRLTAHTKTALNVRLVPLPRKRKK